MAPTRAMAEMDEKLKQLFVSLEEMMKKGQEEMMKGQEAMKEELKNEMKSGQDAVKEELNAMNSGQDAMKEDLNAMKSGQDAMKEELKSEMKSSQDAMKEELKNEMKSGQDAMKEELNAMNSGQEAMKKELFSVKNVLQERLSTVENKIDGVEVDVSKIKHSVKEIEEKVEVEVNKIKDSVNEIEEKVERKLEEGLERKIDEKFDKKIDEKFDKKVDEKFYKKMDEKFDKKIDEKFYKKVREKFEEELVMNKEIQAKVESLENELKSIADSKGERNTNRELIKPSIKLSTYDGKSSWQVYKTQFAIVANANGWDSETKACQLAASLRAEAADILQTLPEEQRLDFNALSSALELRFGEKCMKDYSRLQLKSRQQKATETLQELATDVERLAHLAFSDCPAETREILSLQYFIDGIRDVEIQKALRMADVKDLRSALVYAMKYEAAQQATRRERHPIRAATIQELDHPMAARIDELERQIQSLVRNKQEKKQSLKCWNCGGEGHIRRNCRTYPATGANIAPRREEGN